MKITFEFDKDDVAHAGRIAQAALSNIGGVINTLLETGIIDKTKLSETLSTGGKAFVHTQTQAGYPPPSAAPSDFGDPMLRKVRAVNLLLRLFPGTMKKPEFDLFAEVGKEVFEQIDALALNPLDFRKFQWDKRDVLNHIQARFPSVESFVEALEYPHTPLVQGPKLVSFLKACLDYTMIQPEEVKRSSEKVASVLTTEGALDAFSWNETSWRSGPHPAHRILNPAPTVPPTITPLATDDALSQSTVFQGSFWSGAGAGASGVAVGEGVLAGVQEYQDDEAETLEAPTADHQQEAYRLLLALCRMPEGTHPAHVVGRLVDEEPLRPPLDMRLVAPLVNYQNSTFRKTYASLEEFLSIALGGMNITDLHYALFKLASLIRVMLQNFHSFNVEDVRRGEDRLDTYATKGDSQVAAGILVFSEKRAAEERPMLIEGQSAWVELLTEWVKGYGQEEADQPDRMKLLNSVMANFNRQIRLYLCYVGGLTHACRDAFSLIYANQGASRLILTQEQRAFAREVAENINTICSLRFQQFCVFLEKDKAEAYLPGKHYTAA